jgi:hypothetical protein
MLRKCRRINGADRRNKCTPLLSRYSFGAGRRRKARRKSDRRKHLFADSYSLHLLLVILALLLFSYIDSYLTLTLMYHNIATEGNPVMAFHMEHGTLSFIFNKGFITSISLVVLCTLKNLYIAKVGLILSVLLYFSVVLYELFLLFVR